MKNWINPAVNKLREDSSSPIDKLDTSIDVLINNLLNDVTSGKIRINSISDLSRLMNVRSMLDERKKMEEVPEELQYNVFDELLEAGYIDIDKLYNKAYETYNKHNDDKNKE